MQGGMKCGINTVVSPDDGYIVARNMYRLINKLRNKHTKNKLCTALALFTRSENSIVSCGGLVISG